MGHMKLTAELLHCENKDLNLGLLVPNIVEVMAGIMTLASMRFAEEFLHVTGEAPEVKQIEPNWGIQFAGVANALPDFLADTYEELYGPEAPVALGHVTDYRLAADRGTDPDVAMVKADVDGEALLRLSRSNCLFLIRDGHGVSGFTRTATDAYWSRIQCLSELQWHMEPLHEEKFIEFFREDIENRMDFGEQAGRLYG